MIFLQPFIILLFVISAITTTYSCQPKSNPAKQISDTTGDTISTYIDSLPRPVGYVNDFENIYTPGEEKSLDSLIRDFEMHTTIQIAVITIDSTLTTKDGVDALTKRFANEWGVGQKDKDNGVTIGISKTYRRMRIENGYGIQKIFTDSETKEIIDGVFIPEFRKGNYFEGTFNGLKTLMGVLEKRTEKKLK